jgi:hypothetical protein
VSGIFGDRPMKRQAEPAPAVIVPVSPWQNISVGGIHRHRRSYKPPSLTHTHTHIRMLNIPLLPYQDCNIGCVAVRALQLKVNISCCDSNHFWGGDVQITIDSLNLCLLRCSTRGPVHATHAKGAHFTVVAFVSVRLKREDTL